MSALCLLYYITDRTAFGADEPTRRRRLLEKISEAASAGVDYIQLREKDLSTRDLESLAREAVNAIRKALPTVHYPLPTALLINTRTDVALAVGAHGVHLRNDDLSAEEVRVLWKKCGVGAPARVQPRAPLIAVSCHSPAEVAQAAQAEATLAVFAPVFEKKDATPAGIIALRRACEAKIPVLALGGVTLSNARSCLEAGAAGIAAIRLFQENEIAAVVKDLRSPHPPISAR
jgi:thiamine-phosphate pyrophosphorylase